MWLLLLCLLLLDLLLLGVGFLKIETFCRHNKAGGRNFMRSRDLFRFRSQDSLFLFLLGYWILSVSNPFLLTGVTDTAEGSVPFELALRSSLFPCCPRCF